MVLFVKPHSLHPTRHLYPLQALQRQLLMCHWVIHQQRQGHMPASALCLHQATMQDSRVSRVKPCRKALVQ